MSQSLRIAVADDELDMRDYYQRILPRLGHRVVGVAATGAELLAVCRQARPDLVITDIKMPEVDGIEAASRLCAEGPLPVLLVSAHHDEELIRRADGDCVMGYLVKPIKQADLAPAITRARRRFDQLQRLRQEGAERRRAFDERRRAEPPGPHLTPADLPG